MANEVHKIQYDGENVIFHTSDGKKYLTDIKLRSFDQVNPANSTPAASPMTLTKYLVMKKGNAGDHTAALFLEVGADTLKGLVEELRFQNLVYYDDMLMNQDKEDPDFKSFDEFADKCIQIRKDYIRIYNDIDFSNQWIIVRADMPIEEIVKLALAL